MAPSKLLMAAPTAVSSCTTFSPLSSVYNRVRPYNTTQREEGYPYWDYLMDKIIVFCGTTQSILKSKNLLIHTFSKFKHDNYIHVYIRMTILSYYYYHSAFKQTFHTFKQCLSTVSDHWWLIVYCVDQDIINLSLLWGWLWSPCVKCFLLPLA